MEVKSNEIQEDKIELEEKKLDGPSGGLEMKIFFIIFGIGSLLAWNAILSDISFFIFYQGKYDPPTSFAFFNFFLNIAFQFVMIWNKQLISFKTQLLFGLIASIITLVALPIVVSSFEKNSLKGFIITGVIVVFQGLVNAFCCNGFYALVSFFPIEQIIALSSGQGISGILMNVIEYVILASINTGDEAKNHKIGAVIFFSISGFILLINLVILLFAFKTEYFQFYLSKTKDFNTNNNTIEGKIRNEGITTRSTGGNEKEEKLTENEKEEKLMENATPIVKERHEVNFCELFFLLYDVDLLSCYIYIVTFALFPSVSISQRLFDFDKYRQITIITIYNVFDTVGRSVVSKIKPTKILSYIVICGRSILLFTLIFNHYLDMKADTHTIYSICLMLNVSILALTNGIGTSLTFGLAPTLVPDELKGRAGGSIGFFNILGIFLGTCLAFLSKYIMGRIGSIEDRK